MTLFCKIRGFRCLLCVRVHESGVDGCLCKCELVHVYECVCTFVSVHVCALACNANARDRGERNERTERFTLPDRERSFPVRRDNHFPERSCSETTVSSESSDGEAGRLSLTEREGTGSL